MKVIKRKEFIDMMRNVATSEIVTLSTRTAPSMRKTDNPHVGKVIKVSRVNGVIGFNYQNAVRRQQDREGGEADFVSHPRKWGTRIPKSCLVEHEGKLYIEMKVNKSLGHEYRSLIDNSPFDESLIKPFMTAKRSSAEHQGVDKEVIVRDYNIDSIDSISFKGETYQILG